MEVPASGPAHSFAADGSRSKPGSRLNPALSTGSLSQFAATVRNFETQPVTEMSDVEKVRGSDVEACSAVPQVSQSVSGERSDLGSSVASMDVEEATGTDDNAPPPSTAASASSGPQPAGGSASSSSSTGPDDSGGGGSGGGASGSKRKKPVRVSSQK